PQQVKLWSLLAHGLETTEIAERVHVSERTAKRMVASLIQRVGARNRIEAAAMAGRYGLLDADSWMHRGNDSSL
ncbi:MAG: LuxR C-terminal-related transcriptional regulator, partial [Rhodococcus sp. (in: high G+C Gram-positive bacteria)]